MEPRGHRSIFGPTDWHSRQSFWSSVGSECKSGIQRIGSGCPGQHGHNGGHRGFLDSHMLGADASDTTRDQPFRQQRDFRFLLVWELFPRRGEVKVLLPEQELKLLSA